MTLPVAILGRNVQANLGRLSIVYDLRLVSLVEGLRAGLAVSALVLANEWLNWLPLGEAAIAAMLACLADAGGPLHRRLPYLLAFAVAGGAISGGFGLLLALPVWVVVPTACLAVFALTFLRVYGQSGLQLGNLLCVAMVLAMDHRAGLAQALEVAGGFALGGVWVALLTLVFWRLRPLQPARSAVAEAYRALAEMVADMRGLLGGSARRPQAVTTWEEHARAHRRAVRTAIEQARVTVLETLTKRGRAQERTPTAAIRLESADQMFGALIGFADLLESTTDPAALAAADGLLRVLRPMLVVLTRAAETDAAVRLAPIERGLVTMQQKAAALPAPLQAVAGVIVARLQVAVTLAVPDGFLPLEAPARKIGWVQRVIGPIRGNLDLKSAGLRHALRAATVALPAFALTQYYPTTYGHWLTITLIMTLQPFFSLTTQRALERTGGTLAGGILAAALAMVLQAPWALAAATFPLTAVAFALRPAGFGLMMTFLTPLVVLLSELGQPGNSELVIAGMRALYTSIGALLSIAGGVFLWPSRETARLRTAVATALRVHAEFARAVFEGLGSAGQASADRARQAAGRASNDLELSLSRALQEPHRSAARLEAALVTDSALRRLAGRLTALQLGAAVGLSEADRLAWRDWLGSALNGLAAGSPLPRPPETRNETLARIGRQVGLIDGALQRFRQG